MTNKDGKDLRIWFMEKLCIGEADAPSPILSCTMRYGDGTLFCHTVGETTTRLCAEGVRHTLLASLLVLFSALGKCALSVPIKSYIPQFPMKNASLFDLLCHAIPMKLKEKLPPHFDLELLCGHLVQSDTLMHVPHVYEELLLTSIIERVSDMTVREALAQFLFSALDMSSTLILENSTSDIRLPYHRETDTVESMSEAKGKLFSSSHDLLRFLCALLDAAKGKLVPVFTQKTASILLTPHKETLATPAFQMRGTNRSALYFPDLASPTAYLSTRDRSTLLFLDTAYGDAFAVVSDNTALSQDDGAVARLGNVLLHTKQENSL